jgi:two-component system sensor kinase FixL
MSESRERGARSPLRHRAEARILREAAPRTEPTSAEDVRKLVHELRVYQVELEMQNHELREAQRKLEESRDALLASEQRYRVLYEFAPVAYLTLDPDGIIVEANLSAARALQVERGRLPGRKFADFVAPADQDRWYLRRKGFGAVPAPAVLDLNLERSDGSGLHAELVLAAEERENCASGGFRVALVDVSERRRLQQEVVDIAWRQQRALGQELHDAVAQELSALAIHADRLGRRLAPGDREPAQLAERLAAGIRGTLSRIRALARGLFPVDVDAQGLEVALEQLVASAREDHAVDVRLVQDGALQISDSDVAAHLFRIVQEALANAIRHAHAKTICVELTGRREGVQIRIADDGVGIAPGVPSAGMGLQIMRFRASLIGASLETGSAPQGGTVLTCRMDRSSFDREG